MGSRVGSEAPVRFRGCKATHSDRPPGTRPALLMPPSGPGGRWPSIHPTPGLTFLSADQQAVRGGRLPSCPLQTECVGCTGGSPRETGRQPHWACPYSDSGLSCLPLAPPPQSGSHLGSRDGTGIQGHLAKREDCRPQSHCPTGPWHWGGGGNLPTTRNAPQTWVGPGASAGFSAAKSGCGAGRVRRTGNGRDQRTQTDPHKCTQQTSDTAANTSPRSSGEKPQPQTSQKPPRNTSPI